MATWQQFNIPKLSAFNWKTTCQVTGSNHPLVCASKCKTWTIHMPFLFCLKTGHACECRFLGVDASLSLCLPLPLSSYSPRFSWFLFSSPYTRPVPAMMPAGQRTLQSSERGDPIGLQMPARGLKHIGLPTNTIQCGCRCQSPNSDPGLHGTADASSSQYPGDLGLQNKASYARFTRQPVVASIFSALRCASESS